MLLVLLLVLTPRPPYRCWTWERCLFGVHFRWRRPNSPATRPRTYAFASWWTLSGPRLRRPSSARADLKRRRRCVCALLVLLPLVLVLVLLLLLPLLLPPLLLTAALLLQVIMNILMPHLERNKMYLRPAIQVSAGCAGPAGCAASCAAGCAGCAAGCAGCAAAADRYPSRPSGLGSCSLTSWRRWARTTSRSGRAASGCWSSCSPRTTTLSVRKHIQYKDPCSARLESSVVVICCNCCSSSSESLDVQSRSSRT